MRYAPEYILSCESPDTESYVIERLRYLEELVAAVTAGKTAERNTEDLVDTILMEDHDHLLKPHEHRASNQIEVN